MSSELIVLTDELVNQHIAILQNLKKSDIWKPEITSAISRAIDVLAKAKGMNYELPEPVFPPERHICIGKSIGLFEQQDQQFVIDLRRLLSLRLLNDDSRLALVVAHHVLAINIPRQRQIERLEKKLEAHSSTRDHEVR